MSSIFKPKSIKSSINETEKMKTGDFTSKIFKEKKYDIKIGDVSKCECGKSIRIIDYGSYDLDSYSKSICFNCLKSMFKRKIPKKYIKENNKLQINHSLVRKAIEKIKPRHDGIMEFDRVMYIISSSIFYDRPRTDWDSIVENEFKLYFKRKNKLRI